MTILNIYAPSATPKLIESKEEFDYARQNEHVLLYSDEHKGFASLNAQPQLEVMFLGIIEKAGFDKVKGRLYRIQLPPSGQQATLQQ